MSALTVADLEERARLLDELEAHRIQRAGRLARARVFLDRTSAELGRPVLVSDFDSIEDER